MIHFVIEVDGRVQPLCDDWAESSNWTTVPRAVSCSRCLARLARVSLAPPRPRRTEPAAPAAPDAGGGSDEQAHPA